MLGRVRGQLTYANVMSSLAVFLVLGGTGYAAAKGSIDSRAIKNNSIRASDIATNAVGRAETARNSVGSTEVVNGSLRRGDFKAGELPAGPRGLTGATGPAGPAGSARAFGRVDANGTLSKARNATANRRALGIYCVGAPGVSSADTPIIVAADSLNSPTSVGSSTVTGNPQNPLSGGASTDAVIEGTSTNGGCPAGQWEVRAFRRLVNAFDETISLAEADSSFMFMVP